MRTLTVTVTQNDIDAGAPQNCRTCPVAKAASRATGETVFVGELLSCFSRRRELLWEVPLPRVVSEFVRAFDWGLSVRPFSFPLLVPDDLLSGGEP